MSSFEFGLGPEPTIPDDANDQPRFGQPVETTKDAFVLELRKFFDRNRMTSNRVVEIPTIRKYDVSNIPSENSLETAVKLIQKFPNINEDLPLVAVLGATGRSMQLGIGTQFVGTISMPSNITGTNTEPFALVSGDTLIYKTTTDKGDEYISTIIFRQSRFVNMAQATANEVIDEINFQSLYARGNNSVGKITLSYGGAVTTQPQGDIEIVGGTSLTALGFTVGQKALYRNSIPYHRYQQTTSIDIAIEIVAEDHNIRTELTDLVVDFFSFYMDSRDYMFLGQSIFDYSISNETYQTIISPSLSLAGEQEVPRPGDEVDKLYVNRINVSVTTIQYVDRAVYVPGTSTPLYIDTDNIEYDDTLPGKN